MVNDENIYHCKLKMLDCYQTWQSSSVFFTNLTFHNISFFQRISYKKQDNYDKGKHLLTDRLRCYEFFTKLENLDAIRSMLTPPPPPPKKK